MKEYVRYCYIFDGYAMKDRCTFFEDAAGMMTLGIDFVPGYNLDAFTDLLRGGFGMHAYGETIRIIWVGLDRSRHLLGEDFTGKVLRILSDEEEEYSIQVELHP